VQFIQLSLLSQLVAIFLNSSHDIQIQFRTGLELFGLLMIPALLSTSFLIIKNKYNRQPEMAGNHRKIASEIAVNQQNESNFQAYVDKITDLLLKENLRNSSVESEVRLIARARTITTLPTLDATRKGKLLRFLFETHLLFRDNNILDLTYADLRNADLEDAYLIEANLQGAALGQANLNRANLVGANLTGADLSGAAMVGTHLSRADLNNTNLAGTDLREAFLIGANLQGVDLSGANLRGANLKGARLTEEQLSKAKSIDGATLPDGRIQLTRLGDLSDLRFSDWRKVKIARQ
jgi:uncharacterized protein YjbI with pentapeptide repeats